MRFVKVTKKLGAAQFLEVYLNLGHVQEVIVKEGSTVIVLIRGATFNVKETPEQILSLTCWCEANIQQQVIHRVKDELAKLKKKGKKGK